MGYHPFAERVARYSRRGLSFLEFFGCIVALGSGLVIGSIYLGVDVKTLLVGVMEQAEIVEPGYFAEQEAATQTDSEPSHAALANETNEPSQTVSQETAREVAGNTAKTIERPQKPDAPSSLESVISNLVAEDTTETTLPLTEQEIATATQEYWEGLAAGIRQEVNYRTTLPESQSNWQLFEYLSHRAEGHEKAIEAIDTLKARAVDEQLLHHGKQVRDWHEAGAKLYRKAVALLTNSPKEQFSGPSAQSWQSSSTQHRMEEKLVRDKHFSISNYLNHTYGALGAFHPAY